MFIFAAHLSAINHVSVSADGAHLASSSTDETIRLYDIKKGVELGSLHAHDATPTSLTFHHAHFISTASDGTLLIYRRQDYEVLKSVTAKGGIRSFGIHPSGKMGLSVGDKEQVMVWDLVRGARGAKMALKSGGGGGGGGKKLGGERVEEIQFVNKGEGFAVRYDAHIDLYDIATVEKVGVLQHPKRIHAMASVTMEDGQDYLVTGSEDGFIRVWDIGHTEKGKKEAVKAWKGHSIRIKAVSTITVSVPGDVEGEVKRITVVVTGDSKGVIRYWDLGAVLKEDGNDEIPPMGEYDAKCRITCMATGIVPSKSGEGVKKQQQGNAKQRQQDAQEVRDDAKRMGDKVKAFKTNKSSEKGKKRSIAEAADVVKDASMVKTQGKKRKSK